MKNPLSPMQIFGLVLLFLCLFLLTLLWGALDTMEQDQLVNHCRALRLGDQAKRDGKREFCIQEIWYDVSGRNK